MRQFIIAMVVALGNIPAFAKPHCQGFNNYDDKVTIVFTDDKAGSNYSVTFTVCSQSYPLGYGKKL